jgi:hypothetical protein
MQNAVSRTQNMSDPIEHTNQENPVLKKLAYAGLAVMLVLFIVAAIFYKERALFSDAAFMLFKLINESALSLPENGRYGALIVQVLPLLALKLHLSVNVILFLYSVSFNLFYLVVCALLVLKLRQYRLSILMALSYLLFVSQSFFWISDIFIGMGWMFLFFAVTLWLGNKKVHFFLLLVPFCILAFLTIFTHFVLIIPTVFLWVYLVLEKKYWPFSKSSSIVFSLMLALIIILKLFDARNYTRGYDADHLNGVLHLSFRGIIHAFNTPVVKVFFYRCLVNYWVSVIVLLAGIFSLIKYKQLLLAVLTVASVLGYIIIMGLTYADLSEEVLMFHIESEWACIGVIAAAGFVRSFLSAQNGKVALSVFIAVAVIRLVYIVIAGQPFAIRIHESERIVEQMSKTGKTKVALITNDRLREINMLDWGSPYESLMLSAVHKDSPTRTFFYVSRDDTAHQRMVKEQYGFFDSYAVRPTNFLNKQYFNIDTSAPYQLMTYGELFK